MNFLSAVLTILSSFLITFLLMPSLIKYFRAKKEGQQIRKEGPTWHAKKAGTPTMGGLLFIFSAVVTILWVAAWQGLITNTLWALLFVLVVYGLIGMWDDSIKIFHHQNEGFKPWQKALCQVLAAMIGTLLGFFPYNHKPAKIFMGDMGSLAIGASLAAVSLLLHHEWSLLVIGIVYVCETASVILQVASFKTTGKRIFKMTPIHHHFEMSGWSEWKIDIVFWLVGLVAAIIAVTTILLVG